MILCKYSYDTMKLEDLTQVLQPISVQGAQRVQVKGLTYDSRLVLPGYVFVAISGGAYDGVDFIDEAVRRGAVVVVSEHNMMLPPHVTLIRVKEARKALAQLSNTFHQHPSTSLTTIGVTGTNGKTTVSYMIRAILKGAGQKTGLLGTVEYLIGERKIPANRTTPQAPELQAMLDEMIGAGCQSAVMEVSSHALDQYRVYGTEYDVAVFTNLSQDHLDYHQTMEAYYSAKVKLFDQLGERGHAVINIDDVWGRRLFEEVKDQVEVITYGESVDAMVRAEKISLTQEGVAFRLYSPWGGAEVELKLLGNYNVLNALAAIATGGTLGIELLAMTQSLDEMRAVPGRLERVPGGRGGIYVDYAHTDHALENVLMTLRDFTPGRLIVVFGCGGDRDREKRALMGGVADRLADALIITNDNPRSEDPERIARDIQTGIQGKGQGQDNVQVILDREQAIAEGIAMLDVGDTLLIAGKGHENFMEFAKTIVPFDDRQVALALVSRYIRD